MLRALALFLYAGLLLTAWGYGEAIRQPLVRRAEIAVPGWPAGQKPLRVALLSDLHLAGPDMPPERLAAIVAQVNAEQPDLVLLAGDFFSDKAPATRRYPEDAIIAPLAALRPRLGSYAVLGNHDHWRDAPAIRRAVTMAGVRVLDNEAVRVGGMTLAGVDDVYTRHARFRKLETYAEALPGPAVLLSHSPDATRRASRRFGVILAGHTHCSQIVLPLIGPIATASTLSPRYSCGVVRDPARTFVVSAGLGTSIVPIRFGARPDWWLLTLGPRRDTTMAAPRKRR